jgi:hypothetical protein
MTHLLFLILTLDVGQVCNNYICKKLYNTAPSKVPVSDRLKIIRFLNEDVSVKKEIDEKIVVSVYWQVSSSIQAISDK